MLSEACQAALVMHHHLLTEALEEIEELCTGASWLNGIHAFCKSWNEESVYQWRGAAAFTIEVGDHHGNIQYKDKSVTSFVLFL